MDTLERATRAVELMLMSLDYKKAPRYDKDKIEQARAEASEGLKLALDLLSKHTECAYCEAGIAEQHLAERASK